MKLVTLLSCVFAVSGTLNGTTTADYDNRAWDCTSVEQSSKDTCLPLAIQDKGSLFRLLFFKSGCPSDSACHTSCPGGTISTSVTFGGCPPIDDPWERRSVACNGSAQFISPQVTTAGCITEFFIRDSFGGDINFTLYSVSSSSFTSEMSNISCPGIGDAFLRDNVTCTAIASHNNVLTSFDEITEIEFTPASGGMAGSGSYPGIAGQNIVFQFVYTLSAFPSASLDMNYTMYYTSPHSEKKHFPPTLVTLDRNSHRLPKLKPSVDSLLQCEFVDAGNDDTKFTHSCNVTMLDSIGPVDYPPTEFEISASTMGQHVPCPVSVSPIYSQSSGFFKFDVIREGLCLGEIPTIVQVQIEKQNITSVDMDGRMSHNGVLLWDEGAPLPPTPAPPTAIPPTASPTVSPPTQTPFTDAPATPPPSSGSSKTVGIILGILAVVVAIVLIVAITCCLVRHRQSKNAGTFSVLATNPVVDHTSRSGSLKGSWHRPSSPGPVFNDDEGPSTQLLQEFSKTDDGDALAINECADYHDMTGEVTQNSNRSSLIDVAE
eukprot:TRINITY_DN5018_c1_g1_i1.p1 TRINITY_DN5018_c1_g1~~TRINITY_DN5018_c1_g1_i1.p1  ORF type:complete len:545 (+),score=70.55 TRINITY_DN5018_c1_g1_i1:73-1707(+)